MEKSERINHLAEVSIAGGSSKSITLNLIGQNQLFDVPLLKISDKDVVDRMVAEIGEFRVRQSPLKQRANVFMLGPKKNSNCEVAWNCLEERFFEIKSFQSPHLFANQPMIKGYSGGPVLDDHGQLAGIVLSKDNSSSGFKIVIIDVQIIDRMLWGFGIDLLED